MICLMLGRNMELVRGITRVVRKKRNPVFTLLSLRFRLLCLGEQITHMRYFNVLKDSTPEALLS